MAGDPYFSSVSLLLHCDGTNGGTTFTDSGPASRTVTRVAAITSTTQINYGSASGSFDGSSAYLTSASNAAFAFGTGDFTVECWTYNTGTTSRQSAIYDLGATNSAGSFALFAISGNWTIRTNGTSTDLTYPVSSAHLNAWVHLAVVRISGVITFYINGVSVATRTAAGDITQSTPYIGKLGSFGGYNYLGYIDDLRITKGVARYTANFTPPTAAFPDSAGGTDYTLACAAGSYAVSGVAATFAYGAAKTDDLTRNSGYNLWQMNELKLREQIALEDSEIQIIMREVTHTYHRRIGRCAFSRSSSRVHGTFLR